MTSEPTSDQGASSECTVFEWGPDASTRLTPGAVHLWRVPLRRLGSLGPAALEAALDEEERHRASMFRADADRRRFIVRRAARREILAMYLGCAPVEVEIHSSVLGRPVVVGPRRGRGLTFSTSHRGELGVVAVGRGIDLGVDVEVTPPVVGAEEAGQMVLSAAERAQIAALPEELRTRAFVRCWTCKEALLKAMGVGLTGPLERIEVEADPRRPARLIRGWDGAAEGPGWVFAEPDVGAGWVAVVAYRAVVDEARHI